MNKKLLISALRKYLAGLICVSILLFLPAGTIFYPNGWLFISLLFIPMLFLGMCLYIKAPSLLEKRLNAKENRSEQRLVIAGSALIFILGFTVAGLDFRFGWSNIPRPLITASAILLLVSYALYGEVMRENSYLSRNVEVQKGQKLIDTGLYGIVRHPMYTATIMLFLSIPIVLGSLYSFLIFLVYPFLIILRISGEEKLLEQELSGYTAYKKKVKYRLIPFIW